MRNHPPTARGPRGRRGGPPGWWPLASYSLVGAALLAVVAGLGYWAGRHSRPPPLGFIAPTPTLPAPVTAYVAGLVARPGVYTLPADARLIDLVVAAGGLLPDADHAALNLAARVADGQRVIVPAVRPALAAPDPAAPGSGNDTTAAGPRPSGVPLNLNLASQADLETLPRIGPSTAAAIVEWRDRNGGFGSVEDLLGVRGIGQATLEAIRPYVTAP